VIRFARLGLLVIVMGALAVSGCGGIGPERTASGTTASTRLDASGVTRLDVAYAPTSTSASASPRRSR
jgi:hypothetical protein